MTELINKLTAKPKQNERITFQPKSTFTDYYKHAVQIQILYTTFESLFYGL